MTLVLHSVDRLNRLSCQELPRTHLRPGRAANQSPVLSAGSQATSPDREEGTSDGDACGRDGGQLSVTDIQRALRELRARRPGTRVGETIDLPDVRDERTRERWPRGADSGPQGDGGAGSGPVCVGRSDFATDWVTVLSAHVGAGASTVALAISDAAVGDHRVHLVEGARPSRSGLVAATSAELGRDATGAWKRGTRSGITIDRRARDVELDGWPTVDLGETPVLTVVDLGPLASTHLASPGAFRARTVVVCRTTVPGVRRIEQMLSRLSDASVVVAAVGPRRWPRQVTVSIGPRLRALRDAGRVVPVPVDARLEITGLTPASLPKRVLAAGHALVALLDAADPVVVPERWPSPPNAERVDR